MSRHRAAPVAAPVAAPGRRRAVPPPAARPRYGRLAILGASLSVTGVAMLGGMGFLPSVATGSPEPTPAQDVSKAVLESAPASQAPEAEEPAVDLLALPADTGTGRRIVFAQGAQRVWLVRDDESVARTYLVSGSVTDNLQPGAYEVFSRSANAIGVDDAGTMRYFVRFTHGPEGGAIGFHDIPVDDGAPVQTTAQLGSPQSHGCIRQARKDAIALWGFAPTGTPVTVVA
jgi:hypothetical protein